MALRIEDTFVTLEVNGAVVATARFSMDRAARVRVSPTAGVSAS